MNWWIKGVFASVLVAVLLSPFASPHPDGLEKVAEDKGFLELGEGEPILESPVPDYAFPGIENEGVATSMAGLAGTLISFAVAYLVGKGLAG